MGPYLLRHGLCNRLMDLLFLIHMRRHTLNKIVCLLPGCSLPYIPPCCPLSLVPEQRVMCGLRPLICLRWSQVWKCPKSVISCTLLRNVIFRLQSMLHESKILVPCLMPQALGSQRQKNLKLFWQVFHRNLMQWLRWSHFRLNRYLFNTFWMCFLSMKIDSCEWFKRYRFKLILRNLCRRQWW